jgi:hypothetical protein
LATVIREVLLLFNLPSMEAQQMKKVHKGGDIVRVETHDLQLINLDPFFREAFQRVGCLSFCEKMQRGHPEVAKTFSLNFNGVKTKFGTLEFEVTDQSISTATEIPIQGEIWFKAMSVKYDFSKDFLKPKYQEDNLSK